MLCYNYKVPLTLLVIASHAVPNEGFSVGFIDADNNPMPGSLASRSLPFSKLPSHIDYDDKDAEMGPNQDPIFLFPEDAFDFIPVYNTDTLLKGTTTDIPGGATDEPETSQETTTDTDDLCDFKPIEELEKKAKNIARFSRRASDIQCEYNMWSYKYLVFETERRSACPSISGVYGGKNVTQGDFPHMGALGWRTKMLRPDNSNYLFMCGSSLISLRYVLSAAHCRKVTSFTMIDKNLDSEEPVVVRFGDVYIAPGKDRVEHHEDRFIEEFITPKRYKFKYNYNDIMLIRLTKEVDISHNIRPACLQTDDVTSRREYNVTGWGSTKTADSSSILLYAPVKLADRAKCDKQYKRRMSKSVWVGLQDHQICAGGGGTYDTCGGDSGGPLQMQQPLPDSIEPTGTMYYIAGITSFGESCGTSIPGVYTKVSDHNILCWIEKNVWPEEDNPQCKNNNFEGYVYF